PSFFNYNLFSEKDQTAVPSELIQSITVTESVPQTRRAAPQIPLTQNTGPPGMVNLADCFS
ncbi:MAG: hypothetical protein ACI90V_012537, partial [Bacillariaceae sp.]